MPGLEEKTDNKKLKNVKIITKEKQKTNAYTKGKVNAYNGSNADDIYVGGNIGTYKTDVENSGTYINDEIETNVGNEATESTFEKTGAQYYTYLFVKRAFDIVGSIVGIAVLIPVTLVIGVARIILKENDGPLFYEQLRVGKDGKAFRMYKFRTMCIDADEKLRIYLLEHKNEENAKYYKKYKKFKDDPRVTKLGKFLRKTSIDELPQVINIFLGNMSIVGPRPYLSREKEDMGEAYDEIIKVKPGLTGYWQINGRSNATFKKRVSFDLYYIENRSLKLDAKIFLKTFEKVLKKEGAE